MFIGLWVLKINWVRSSLLKQLIPFGVNLGGAPCVIYILLISQSRYDVGVSRPRMVHKGAIKGLLLFFFTYFVRTQSSTRSCYTMSVTRHLQVCDVKNHTFLIFQPKIRVLIKRILLFSQTDELLDTFDR